MENFYVYCLIDPITNLPFYVGKGKGRRISEHFSSAKSGRHSNKHLANKINKILRDGFSVKQYKFIDNVPEDVAFDVEKRLIASLRLNDIKLCNLTDGGEGVSGYKYTEEQNRANSLRLRGRKRSPESVEKSARWHRGKNMPAEAIEKIRLAQIGKTLSDETRKKISEARRGQRLSEEHCAKISQRMSGNNHPLFGKKHNEETRRKMSLARLKFNAEKQL